MAIGNNAPPDEIVRLVEQAGQGLKHRRQYGEAVRVAAESMVPALADFAVAFVRREGGRDYIEVAHVDPARRSPARELIFAVRDLLRHLAVSRGDQPWWWMPTVTPASLRKLPDTDGALRRLFDALAIHSLIVVPLRTGGRLHGALALARTTAAHPFSAAELAAAQTIGHRAAVAIEAAEIAEGVRTSGAKRARLDDVLRKWTRVFHEAAWGAAIVDGEDYRIDVANPGFTRMHGWADAAELTGRPFAELLPAAQADVPASWGRVPGEDTVYETTHVRADGSTFPALVHATYLGGDDMRAYVVAVQDLTALKRTEERLHRAQRMEAVGRLAGGVAHEVSNMVTIILGFSDILGSKGLPDEQRSDLDEIRKAAVRAGNITRQLLAFSRQQVLQPSSLQLNDVVAEMTPVLRLMLPANVRLEAALAASGGSVRADRAQLEQVLINLAFNARDAMSDGGTIRLATEFRPLDATAGERLIGIPIVAGSYGLLSVTDTGMGMDLTTLNQIFDPFFTTKPLGQGTGLGLATVYGIVKQSDGYIWAESAVGQGTTVTVCLPEVEQAPAAAAVVPRRPSRRPATGTILVLEDEEGVRQLASRILQQVGFCVLEAPTGADALAYLDDAECPVDLILTDVVIPDIELNKLERQAHDRRPELPILYMSGYPHEEIVQRGLVAPDQPFLQKPFTATDLTERVRDLVGDRGSRGRR